MKMFDINGQSVNIDVRPSKYPIKGVSKSKLQGLVGQYLQDKYPYEVILEEFYIPGSKMSVDFFLPKSGKVIEIQGEGHTGKNNFFHGSQPTSTKYAGQVSRDRRKKEWAELNNFEFIEVFSEDDICKT